MAEPADPPDLGGATTIVNRLIENEPENNVGKDIV